MNPLPIATAPHLRVPQRRRPFWAFWRPRPPVVPAIRLNGVIGAVGLRGEGLTLQGLERAIERAFRVAKAPAVALLINSPGGSPVQSSLIAHRIRSLATEHDKRVLAFVEDVAASGGYWLALAADEVWCDPSSLLGSIGVVSAGFGFTDAIQKLGVERRVHTAGSRKALLDPFRPEQPADLDLLREIQGDIHGRFKAWVMERRGSRLQAVDQDLFDGRVWTGERAVPLGLADGLGDARDVVRSRFGADTRLMLVNPARRPLLARLGLRPGAGLTDEILAALDERALRQRYGL